MIGRTNAGGAALNFKVVGGTTQPTSPTENTIWVNTDTKITGWDFSATEPQGEDLTAEVATAQGFIYGNGSIGDTSVSYTRYTVDFIPVDTSKKYSWSYSLTSSKIIRLRVAEYDANKTLLAVNDTVTDQVSASMNGAYTFTSASAKYIRLSYYYYEDVECTVKFIEDLRKGLVWIKTETANGVGFNALKKNCVFVYPFAASQYVGGAWVDKSAHIYRDGAWVELNRYLYYSGDDFEARTGGWIVYNVAANSTNYTYSIGTCTQADQYFRLKVVPTQGVGRQTVNKIDLTNVNSIDVTIVQSGKFDWANFYVFVSTASQTKANASSGNIGAIYNASGTAGNSTTYRTVSLDVSALTGGYYVVVGQKTYDGSAGLTTDVYSIELK